MSPDVNDPACRSVTFDQLAAAYLDQVKGLIEGGVDLLLVETVFDTLNAKAALFAIESYFDEVGARIPVMLSVTITDASGRTLSGQTPEAFWNSVSHAGLASVGVNCALGAREMRPYIEELAGLVPIYISCYPNAGLPNAFGEYDESPAETASILAGFAEAGWLNMVGGCCGTTPEHIRAVAEAVAPFAPRLPARPEPYTRLAGLEALNLRPDSNFVNVGERTNVTGSPKFAKLILAGQFEEALAVARQQVEGGAQIIDVNLDEGMLDSKEAMVQFLNLVSSEPDIARVPIMIDSSKWEVIEAGLKCLQGKPVINSISLKEGEEVFRTHARLARRYGAAVIVMAFDESGQAVTTERRVEVCARAYTILTRDLGFPPQDIIFDPNVLTVGTGIEEHNDYAVSFFEATRRIKETLPLSKVSGGVSNVSFAFRGQQSGPRGHARGFSLSRHPGRDGHGHRQRRAAGRLRRNSAGPAGACRGRPPEPAARRHGAPGQVCRVPQVRGEVQGGRGRVAHCPGRGASQPRPGQRRNRSHRGGRRGGQAEVWQAARRYRRPADGRDEHRGRPVRCRQDVPPAGGQERAGDEEGGGLPAAVHGSEKSRPPGSYKTAGKIVMATVKGDVHDIGKNIVGVVLGCNNYEVIDLGRDGARRKNPEERHASRGPMPSV